jgi:tRNA(Ile)-lysidine synthase
MAPDAPRPGELVVVALSAGPDSTALASALAELAPVHGLHLSAGHVDHGLRGAESAADAVAARRLAERLGIDCAVVVAPVAPGPNLEARARAARHRALVGLARERGAACIALAHTEDDQVETVLLRLLRGAGRRGLGGMARRRGRLWRPLLAATRADVRRYLAERSLAFRLDRTNAELRHARNRVRRLVVPLLAREFNPRLGRALATLATRLRDEDAYLDQVAGARLDGHRRGDGLGTAAADEPPAIARRLVRAWLESVTGRVPASHHVERVLELGRGSRTGNVAVPGPARVVRDGDRLLVRPGRRAAAVHVRHELMPGACVEGPDGAWRLAVSVARARDPDATGGLSPSHARFDLDALTLPLVVRSVEPGDRIDVPGVGTRKLQDVLVDAKVPRERRSTIPVVVDASGRVLWVAGIVRGGGARVTDTTRRVLDMDLHLAQ